MTGDEHELTSSQCRELLAGGVLGRVAFCTGDGPRILPVNYTVVDDAVVFRTSAYGALAAHDWRSPLAFEVDAVDHVAQVGWSVLAIGAGERVADADVLERIRIAGDPRPWPTGSRPLYVRLEWRELTGRVVGAEDDVLPPRRGQD
ncbi:pyridoxamine 5'-phosphate oxidase family protein [Nocardioides aurantiacus]|uniref:Nitroimidazol reductase NimA-like FMN-containing flavoprotein (Pyridoxamine 5'-phosphate oxidase superfamily) n=1 Tax=Nocardioides aurantiacus TaxID=86796 RepID=A0A3N2CTX0_9ACTN|nr:pyridoxamine 5'-phosphate oxidase family protein [Nocardioides aurantiacus]ROR90858.1 nitroimidazol reductase NimA-like FMN-containing flavoprotein (pyridoxamine 5'-phosphate oxidase superfamily) [Nocardioides aurantiacus]